MRIYGDDLITICYKTQVHIKLLYILSYEARDVILRVKTSFPGSPGDPLTLDFLNHLSNPFFRDLKPPTRTPNPVFFDIPVISLPLPAFFSFKHGDVGRSIHRYISQQYC